MGGVDFSAQRFVAGGKTQRLNALVGKLAFQAQRALYGDLPIAEVLGVEPFGLGGSLCIAEVEVEDAGNVGIAQFAVLFAQIAPQRLKPLAGVYQLHTALAVRSLFVSQYPNVGGNAGVVEDVERQGDDGFEPIVLQHPAADVALALARVAREQRRAVVYQRNAAAQRRVVLHLLQLVHQEHELPIAGAGEELEFGVATVADDKAWVVQALFAAHAFEVGFPALAVGWIREHEVELVRLERIG